MGVNDDITEITQLVLHERQGRDRGWWQQMRACYATDSSVRLSWFRGTGPEFVDASIAMAGRGDRSTHRLGPICVDVNGDRAFTEMPAAIEVRTVLDGTEVDLVSYARLIYCAERTGAGWLIHSLDPIYERDTLTPVVPGSSFRIDPAELSGYRTPYRMLAHVLNHRGYPIAQDLCGDDDPGAVAEMYRVTRGWALGEARTD